MLVPENNSRKTSIKIKLKAEQIKQKNRVLGYEQSPEIDLSQWSATENNNSEW